jgi:hypothetical protein
MTSGRPSSATAVRVVILGVDWVGFAVLIPEGTAA